MKWIKRIANWTVAGVVIICVAVVFNGIGKGILDLSSDESVIFALAATVVATFLYKRHTTGGPDSGQRTEAASRAVIIGILVMLLTIPSKIRAIPDLTSEVSSIKDGISSLQDEMESIKDQIDSIEHNLLFR